MEWVILTLSALLLIYHTANNYRNTSSFIPDDYSNANDSSEVLSSQRNVSTFKAAVYEHAVYIPLAPSYSRQGALEAMAVNLDVYEKQVILAASEGADIIVFPEDGVYGMVFTRDRIQSFLEYIPDPRQVQWNPCENPERFPNTDVQRRLSCLARHNSIYLVANMGDIKACNNTDPNCPDDGRYQYNTDVVFSPEGALIARYHKQNLYHEDQFNTPTEPEETFFDTPFGKFGTFTCFDVMFRSPAVDLIEKHNIDSVVFPTAWRDVLPVLAAIEYHSAFAVQMGVNFLSANIHLPFARFGGSGIYTPDGPAAFYRDETTMDGRLVLATIPTSHSSSFDKLRSSRKLRKMTSSSTFAFKKNGQRKKHRGGLSRKKLPRKQTEQDVRTKSTRMQSAVSNHSKCQFQSDCSRFQSTVFGDVYNFVWLKKELGKLTTCKGSVCCHLDYRMADALNTSGESYFAVGAFDGMHTSDYIYYLQVCTLLKCASRHSSSCGEAVKTSQTVFSSALLRGQFQTSYVAPEILVSGKNGQEALAMSGWSYSHDRNLVSVTGVKQPVIAVNLFGRFYEKDPKAQRP